MRNDKGGHFVKMTKIFSSIVQKWAIHYNLYMNLKIDLTRRKKNDKSV